MGSNTSNKVGSQGRSEINKLYPEQVVGVWQEGHFLCGKVPAQRYDASDPDMQALMDSVSAQGWLQPGEAWHFEDTGKTHVIFGNRRTFVTEQINNERLASDQEPIAGSYRIVLHKTMSPGLISKALERYSDENNKRKGNDWLTTANAAAEKLKLGVPVPAVLSSFPMIDGEKMLMELTSELGIRTAAPELQQALIAGDIPIRKAMRLARLPVHEQAAAMVYKPAPKAATSVSLAKLRRVASALEHDKSLDGVSARNVIDALLGRTENAALAALVGEKLKPGRKAAE